MSLDKALQIVLAGDGRPKRVRQYIMRPRLVNEIPATATAADEESGTDILKNSVTAPAA